MKMLFIISTDEVEAIYNAMRLANTGVKKGDEVSVFMLGRGVLFEQSSSDTCCSMVARLRRSMPY